MSWYFEILVLGIKVNLVFIYGCPTGDWKIENIKRSECLVAVGNYFEIIEGEKSSELHVIYHVPQW
jgi:hypothetical protein